MFNKDDQKEFRNLIFVRICKQKCPNCQRICGQQDFHVYHRCLYGHQIQAFGGKILKNNSASFLRCENLKPNSQINYNGLQMSWKQFEDYWSNKEAGDAWKYGKLRHI